MEDYFFEIEESTGENKVFVLVIYDIIDNKRRIKLAKFLQGYGFRIQKSAFEALIPKKKYQKLLDNIPSYVGPEDSVRVYKIIGKGQVTAFGNQKSIEDDEIILI